MKDDEMASRPRRGSRVNGRTVSLRLLEEPEAEEEPPSRVVAAPEGSEATETGRLETWSNGEGADGAFNVSPRTVAQWNDWKWQLRNRLKDLKSLERVFALAPDEHAAVRELGDALPVGITPYYASLMDPRDPADPIRRTMIPATSEFVRTAGEAD